MSESLEPKPLSFTLPNECTHIVWRNREYELVEIHANVQHRKIEAEQDVEGIAQPLRRLPDGQWITEEKTP